MAYRSFRWLGFGLLATGGAAVLGLTSMMHAAFAFADDTAIILGPGGFGDPPPLYVDAVQNLYLDNPLDQSVLPYANYTLDPVSTPEGIFPTSLSSVDSSVTTAVSDLNTAILDGTKNGGDVVVFGYSESATVALLEETALSLAPGEVNPDQLSFVLVGDPSNPDGGLYERLVPSLSEDFPYHTDVYSQEYDGFADFPKYPADFLADANAFAGMLYDHLTYADLTQADIADAIPLSTTGGDADYFIIPTDYLPLLEPLRLLGEPGNQLADLLQPDLSILVNLGYGNLSETEGYDLGPANVPTAFGLLPDIDTTQLASALEAGWQQGITDAANDIPASQLDTSSLAGLEDAAYTFGITNTPDPSLLEFLQAVGQWGATELGFGASFTDFTDIFTNLQDGFTSFEDGFTNFEDGFANFEADLTNLEGLLSSLDPTAASSSITDALTSGLSGDLATTPLSTGVDSILDVLSAL
jgi:PE-PPE domain